MKTKPNTDQFKQNKLTDFLEGASEKQEKTIPIQPTRQFKEQKIFRLPIDLINELKRVSYEQSVQMGVRVTETEIVEQALRAYLK